ncbi:MAG TPA: ABC transporter permease [Thermomicrobiales bacterium]|nr:ABC transporter permease [Thermomicrobiales bacterium]
MTQYLVRRFAQSAFVFVGLITLIFFLARITGDPTDLYLPLTATADQREEFSHAHGFDRPLLDQYRDFVVDTARLDFGTSLWLSSPALDPVLDRLPMTLLLSALTMTVSFSLALVLGSLSAIRPLSLIDRLTSFVSLLGVSIADFWLALVLIIVFAVKLGVLPTSGTGDWTHLVLPIATLSLPLIGRLCQVTRTAVGEQISAVYVTTARAKGLRPRQVLSGHVLRNALLPILTVAGIQFAGLINGAVIVETVFGWPGIGKLTVDAITRRDFPIIQATVFVVALMTFALNLTIDLCYAVIDPRIRYR